MKLNLAEAHDLVLVVADDLELWGNGLPGKQRDPAPHVDSIAAQDVRFTRPRSQGYYRAKVQL